MTFVVLGILVVVVLVVAAASVRVVQEYERGVIFRLGRVLHEAKGPGLFFIIPVIDRMVKVNLQIVTLDVPPQDVITKDNVTLRVSAVVYFQVFQPIKAVVEAQNYLFATSQIAQTTLRAILSKVDLDDILTERDRLNSDLQKIIDDLTEPWGVKVSLVEIKDVDLPTEMQRAMAKQAEAERERRAKIINAEGEWQASERLAQAAAVIARHPIAYQLRYLQTVTEVSAEKNSTLVIPIPIELLKPFQAAFGGDASTFDEVGRAETGAASQVPAADTPVSSTSTPQSPPEAQAPQSP
ncbi:MAG: slipin family protein [Actinobacteria bacterium]|nr:slipin family protein [Actinomycetota bacterium]